MKILDVIYDGEFLIVQSEEGIGKVKSDIKSGIEKYKGLVINTLDDFKSIKNSELRNAVELAFLDSIKIPWKFINKNAKELPRPITVVYSKNEGFREFVLLSLDAKSILKSVWINEKIAKMIEDFDDYNDEEIISKISDMVDDVKKFVDFDVRIGINVGGDLMYKDGKYYYKDKILSQEEHYGFLTYLVDRYNLVFLQNPFEKKNKELFAQLMKQIKHMCLICSDTTNGNINNACIVNSGLDMKNKVDELKSLRINPIIELKNVLDLQLAVGFNVPLLKYNMVNSNIHNQYEQIEREIKEG